MRTVLNAVGATAISVGIALFVGSSPVEGQPLGTVQGTVKVRSPPTVRPHPVSYQVQVCGTSHPADELVAGRGGALANAIVWLDGLPAPRGLRPRDVLLDQQRCRFLPHVQTAIVGSNLSMTSRDNTLHNVHAFVGTRTLFNIAIPVAGMTVRRRLSEPGRIRFQCDAGHTWMSAHIHVFPHPYHAVSGPDGSFRIPSVPPGTHRVKVWHERLGEKSASVVVAGGGSASLAVQY